VNHRSFILPVILLGALLVLTGCIQQIERPGVSSPTRTPTLAPTFTPIPPTATATPTPTPTPVPTPTPAPDTLTTPGPTPTPRPPLFLRVIEPDYGSTLRTRVVTVSGVTTSGASVRVNDTPVTVDEEGDFEIEVSLEPGINVIEVVASDATGDQVRDFVAVTHAEPTPQPFFLQVTEPVDQIAVSNQPIRVLGRTLPHALVTVNGVSIRVGVEGEFSTLVELQPGPNTIEVEAFAGGRTLPITRTVTFVPPS
jgi:hypothetical protein